jgi:hypothetical protein
MDITVSTEHPGRLIVWRWRGDVVAGSHLRDFAVETRAAREALRLLLAGEEPKKASWRVFPVEEGAIRDATPRELEEHFRWRVYEYATALRDLIPARKAKRPSAKGRKVAP